MGPKEKKGVTLLIGFFVIMGIILYFTISRPSTSNTFQDNPLINQRFKNRN